MDIFAFLLLAGGLAFFLFGMNVMSSSLEKLAGSKLEVTLRKMTSNKAKSIALGAGITIAIQSSSAMTVMLVGLVNSGIMELGQTVGLIMGSNIGTTLTAWLTSLMGLESDNVFLKLLKPENFSLLFALVGVVMTMMCRKARQRDLGSILIGFAVLMYGMTMMSSAVSPLTDSEEFSSILLAFNNPLLGVLVGTVFTGIIQSSAAAIVILQAFALTGSLTFGMAIPLIMGMNIGTCATALLSSIGVKKDAKRVVAVHLSIKTIGTVICLIIYYVIIAVFGDSFRGAAISVIGIALCHSIFNIVTSVFLLPFSKKIERLAHILVRGGDEDRQTPLIDERLLNTPGLAISECENLAIKMSQLARETLLMSAELNSLYDQSVAEKVIANEQQLDLYEDKLGSVLVKIAAKSLSDSDSRHVFKLLHSIGDFERIGDHALNLQEAAKELYDKNLEFSEEARNEVRVLTAALTEILDTSVLAYANDDQPLASTVEPLEEVIDRLIEETKLRHINRLQQGKCTIQLGFILSDILNNYERVSDHCSNIAVCVLEVTQGDFDSHEYLAAVKSGHDDTFQRNYAMFSKKYVL